VHDGYVDVGLEAHLPLLHARLGDAEIPNQALQLDAEDIGLVGVGQVRPRNDLQERRAGTIQVDPRVVQPLVQVLARVLLQMGADDADRPE
jgi:hypothetical protein